MITHNLENLEKYERDHHRQQMVRGKRCEAVRGHAREWGAEHGRGLPQRALEARTTFTRKAVEAIDTERVHRTGVARTLIRKSRQR